jgi:hypothetical protein
MGSESFKDTPVFCEKFKKSGIAERILARAPAGIDEKWVLKIKNAPVLCEKCKSKSA